MYTTNLGEQTMVNWKSKQLGDFLWFGNAILVVVLINLIASNYFFRIDLTEENRYLIKDKTKEILENLDDDVHVEVYLEGDMNAGFKRFQKAILETLREFEVYSDRKVHYALVNPSAAVGKKAQSEFMAELARRGIQPTNVIDTKDGQRKEKIIFPGVIVYFGGAETGITLLKGNKAASPDEEINQSIEGIEFELVSAIERLSKTERKRIGLVVGHDELDSLDVASFNNELLQSFDVFKVNLSESKKLSEYSALVIAKPTKPFSPTEKYHLDQYIMGGGKVMFLIDRLEASMENASRPEYLALPYDLNLDDQFFRYGVRINPDLVQDQSAAFYPVVTGQVNGKSKFQLMNWPFFPLVNRYAEHPVTRNLDATILRFANTIDTVKAAGIRKTPLLWTTPATRKLTAPVPVNVNDLRKYDPKDFNQGSMMVGCLLEGKFTSLYKNRFLPEGMSKQTHIDDGKHTRLIVIADGDIARNEINPRSNQPQALGFDPFTNYTFANKDLLMNAMMWLTEEDGLIQTRSKQVMIRPLDREKIAADKFTWQLINLGLPVLLIVGYGLLRAYWRKKRYASF
ncbi:gliding motility-associated ABC transporter substrate-binding protein GldG [Pseudochryseolinea flava]|nr:gliding motility-associated ABC transporter substrate-binding protein GldG [Pseudochryseolinea flava]